MTLNVEETMEETDDEDDPEGASILPFLLAGLGILVLVGVVFLVMSRRSKVMDQYEE